MKKGCSNKKTIFPKLLAILVSLIFVLQITSQAAQDINLGNATSEKEQTVKKTEVITTFEWIEDVDRSIGDIEIKEDGRKVDMVGNPTNPGKNAIYLIPENHQEQNLTFDYTVDYGDSFNAAGILLKIREQKSVNVTNEKIMFNIIKSAYMQRRKTLLNSLTNVGFFKNKEQGINILKKLGLREDIRPENLSIEDFARLSDVFMKNLKK